MACWNPSRLLLDTTRSAPTGNKSCPSRLDRTLYFDWPANLRLSEPLILAPNNDLALATPMNQGAIQGTAATYYQLRLLTSAPLGAPDKNGEPH